MLIRESALLFDLSALRENTFLDAKQEAFVRATISSTQDFIDGLDVKIRHIENELAELLRQRDAALETMAIPAALLAPVRRFPPEVLGEIFQRCVPIEPTHVTPFDSRDAPLLLTRVCHRWRQVAHGTPLLWNKLVVYGRTPESVFSSMWLNNAGSLPLDISVARYPRGLNSGRRFRHVGDPIGPGHTGHGWRMDRYMVWLWPEGVSDQNSRIIVEQATRLRRLSLVCKASDLRSYFPRATTTFPSLQELCVKSTQNWDVDRTDYFLLHILTPRLHTLFLKSCAEFLLHALKCTSNLRILDIRGGFSLEMFVDFASRCPALQRIDAVDISVKAPWELMDMSHTVLPCLSHLVLDVYYESADQTDDEPGVDGEDWSRRTKSLERLRTPNLQQADIRSLPQCERFLYNCMADSPSKLHTLKISYVELDAVAFNNATSIFTAVEKMEFFDCESRAGFWESLIHTVDTPSHTWTLPKLKTLLLEEVRIQVGNEAEFVRFVERRAPPMRPHGQFPLEEICYLKEIELNRCRFSTETFSALERLRENREGFSITIKDCQGPQSDSEVDL